MLSDHNHDFVILGGGVAGVAFALEASRRGRVGYGGLLFLLGWVTPDEFGVMGRAVRGARPPALGTSGDQSS